MTMHNVIDDAGFYCGEINSEYVSESAASMVVAEPLPSESLSGVYKWRWVGGAWVATQDFRGSVWYNPLDTKTVYTPSSFDDVPSTDYVRWEDGVSKPIDEAERLLTLETSIKKTRATLLLNSDWTDTVSAQTRLGTEMYTAWQTYRQALRDITNQSEYPNEVIWPTAPA